MSDHALIERLRCGVATYDDMADAADRIEAQAAEIARLRAACDASEERERAIELRFWQTVDRNGLTGLPSDMWAALEQLTQDRAALATARREVEQERDEFFNRLGRITEYLDIPVDATAQRIIDAIQERVDNEREACASVEVRLTVPEGAEAWTPLEAWEEALLAFDEAFRETIRAAAKEGK